MTGALNLAFAPLLPWFVLGPLIALAALALIAAFAGGGRGRWWRLVMLAIRLLPERVFKRLSL